MLISFFFSAFNFQCSWQTTPNLLQFRSMLYLLWRARGTWWPVPRLVKSASSVHYYHMVSYWIPGFPTEVISLVPSSTNFVHHLTCTTHVDFLTVECLHLLSLHPNIQQLISYQLQFHFKGVFVIVCHLRDNYMYSKQEIKCQSLSLLMSYHFETANLFCRFWKNCSFLDSYSKQDIWGGSSTTSWCKKF